MAKALESCLLPLKRSFNVLLEHFKIEATWGLIPELVYTLIATTTSQDYLEKFYLPYGDDISLKGFDGIVSYNQNHPYIPKGLSVWEIGTNKDPKRKFDEDFSKAKVELTNMPFSTRS